MALASQALFRYSIEADLTDDPSPVFFEYQYHCIVLGRSGTLDEQRGC